MDGGGQWTKTDRSSYGRIQTTNHSNIKLWAEVDGLTDGRNFVRRRLFSSLNQGRDHQIFHFFVFRSNTDVVRFFILGLKSVIFQNFMVWRFIEPLIFRTNQTVVHSVRQKLSIVVHFLNYRTWSIYEWVIAVMFFYLWWRIFFWREESLFWRVFQWDWQYGRMWNKTWYSISSLMSNFLHRNLIWHHPCPVYKSYNWPKD